MTTRDNKRIIEPRMTDEDRQLDFTLRPRTLSEFIGQSAEKEKLKIFIQAAKERNEVLDHVLLYGPPGLGKTTLAVILAKELGVNIRTTSGPVIEKKGDLASLLTTDLREKDVLFIDEIHRLNNVVEESLYPAMEDFRFDITVGEGPTAKSIRLELPKFTLVGATTRAGLLTSPMRSRFGVIVRLDFYNEKEMLEIVKRSAKILAIEIDEDGAYEIAKRSRGTPRVVNRLLKRVRDYAQVKADGRITKRVADDALILFEVDALGLDKMDKILLLTMINKFGGGPVGLNTLATAIGEEGETIEEVYEPFLVQLGLINRTPRGRVATELAYKHLGIKHGGKEQKELL